MLEAYLFIYIIFFFFFWIGYAVSKTSLGSGLLYVVGVVFVLIFLGTFIAASSGSRGGGVSFGVPVAVLVIFLMGIAGAAFFTAALFHTFTGRRGIQWLILAVVVLGPTGIGVYNTLAKNAAEKAAAAFRAEMELTNVSGTFGGHRVTVPVSPAVEIGASCAAQPETETANCNASFGHPYSFKNFPGFGSTTLEFSSLNASILNCAPEKCTLRRSWCARRNDLKNSPWCWFDRGLEVTLRTGKIQFLEEREKVPLLVQKSPVEGLRIRCDVNYRDTRSCVAHYDVTPSVRAKLRIRRTTPGKEEQTVREAMADVERLWSEMTRTN